MECKLTALPANISASCRGFEVSAWDNQIKALPRLVVDLNASCDLDVDDSPFQTPHLNISERRIPAIEGYFEKYDDTARTKNGSSERPPYALSLFSLLPQSTCSRSL